MTETLRSTNRMAYSKSFSRQKKELTNFMHRAAREAIKSAKQENSILTVLLDAERNAFAAGNNPGNFANVSSGREGDPHANSFILVIGRTGKPIVAAVLDIAVGVNTTMLLHCDLVHVADAANPSTATGRWLVQATADTSQEGYSVQSMVIWNPEGKPILVARQNAAIFG